MDRKEISGLVISSIVKVTIVQTILLTLFELNYLISIAPINTIQHWLLVLYNFNPLIMAERIKSYFYVELKGPASKKKRSQPG